MDYYAVMFIKFIIIITILWTSISAECPPDVPLALCVAAPCDVTSCPCYSDAKCSNDYCGGCNARFYVGAIEVTERCNQCVPDKLRLIGGIKHDGIVEIFVGDTWQKLCTAWRFSDNEADLICRELGYKRGYSLNLAAYGPVGGNYSAPLMSCNSDIDSVLDCSYDRNSTMCLHQNTFYASVVCFNETDVPAVTYRLDSYSNDTNYGQVALYRRGIWGQVCAEYWSDVDAAVFCRQLNFIGGYALKYSGTTRVPFVKTAVNCNGTETNIEQCETQTQICYDNYRAGALCYKSTGLSFSLEGGGKTYGRIEVTFDGEKGSICNVDWTDDDGEILCRQLGFEAGTRYYGNLPPGTGQIYLSNIKCTLYEDSILMCGSSGWKNITDSKCLDHSNDAGVYCYQSVRLSGGSVSKGIAMGRVEVYQKIHTAGFGYWSTLCAESFDQSDADVVCRQLQYDHAKILSPGTFGRVIYNTFTTSVNCTGSEKKLLDCPHTKGSKCKNSDDAIVVCTMDGITNDFKIYLENHDSGKVIVEQYGVNGTTCREGWDHNDANVVCRSLGYKGGNSFGTVQSFRRYDPIWLSEVDCKGTENNLQDCTMKFDVSDKCAGDFLSAGAICYNSTGFLTRLADGDLSYTGRIELSRDGQWGTICDNSWSAYDSRVACKELGFADGIAYRGSYHGPGTGPIYLDGLQCDGTEKSIISCSNNGWNVSSPSCKDHTKDAGAYCYRWVTLSFTRTLYGAVTVWKGNGQYGHVCSDGFDDKAAKVVCREMGHKLAIPLCCSSFGPLELAYVMSDVNCTGSETSIRNCLHKSNNPVCKSNTYASVACSPLPTVPQGGWPVISLLSNSGLGYGFAQVNYFGILGIICSEGFDNNDARVICRENNYVTGYAYKHYTTIQHFSHDLRWLSNLDCKGNESSLSECGNLNWGQTGVCSHLSAAGVFCVSTPGITGMEVRLTNGTSVEGRAELKVDSTWQSICSDTLTNKEASVICRNQGFLDGVLLRAGQYGNGSYIRINGINCTGDEKLITNCILETSAFQSSCKLGAAAVKCYTTIRLTGSDVAEYGRLEMFNGTGWDAVCDEWFDDNDANVICRYLGYVAGKYQCCSRLGVLPPTTRIAITKFDCNGGESKPQDCKFVNGSCSTGNYVTVLCISKFTGEDLSVRLPLNSFYGPVEVRRYGLWGYICDSSWTDKEARVVCKHLGFASGYAIRTRIEDRTPIIMGNVKCFGSEADFDHCTRTKFGEDHGCFSRETVAGVICTDNAVSGVQFNIKGSSLASIGVDSKELYIDSMNFENLDAKVFCKSMNFAGGTTGLYGGRLTISVIDVDCTGTENSLLQCKAFWDPRKTKTNMPAGVQCHQDVRLTSGGTFYGIVEVYKNDTWGAICTKGFDDTEATIVCKDLDYEYGISLCCAPFGYISSPHSVTEVQCTGTESQFKNCKFELHKDKSTSVSACDVGWDYSSVVCYKGVLDTTYKLALAGNSYTGDVIMTYLKVSGRICADGWDDRDARVACNELNFQDGVAYSHYVEEGPRTHGPYWTSDVRCIGTETTISQCPKTGFGKVNFCKTKNYAGVVCYNQGGLYYRLMGGDGRYGRVEVNLFDRWTSICDTHWDQREAHVFCNQIGYGTGDPYYGLYKTVATGKVFETQFECTSKEENLNACPHGRWSYAVSDRCISHENDAGVFCYKSVKLHNGIGRETSAGAVLFYKHENWNLICDEGFTDNSAKVVCKDLGFVDGTAECCSKHGQLGWNLLNNVTLKCRGDEPDVATCVKEEPCKSQTYASVTCYDYILPTTPSPVPTTSIQSTTPVTTEESRLQSNNTLTIVGIVVAMLVIIIICLVVILVVKWRRSLKRHEPFHDDILEHTHDGSIGVHNPLHAIPDDDTEELTIKSSGAVAYLPSPQENPESYSNPTYSKPEPNKTIINVSRTEPEYASLGLGTSNKFPLYDNISSSSTATEEKDKKEIPSEDPVRQSLAESAEIHSPVHTMQNQEWPSSFANDDGKRTEL